MRKRLRAGRLAVRYAYKADPWRAAGSLAVNLVATLCDLMGAIVLKLVFDAVAAGDEAALTRAIALAAFTFSGSLLGHFASTTLGMGLRERTTLYIDTRIADLTAGIYTLEHHERPDHLDELHLLNLNHQRLAGIHDSLVSNLSGIVRLVATVGILGAIHPLLLLLPVAGIPCVLASARAVRLRHEMQDRIAGLWRLQARLIEIGTGRDAGKEVRLFGIGDDLAARWEASRAESDRLTERAEATGAILNALAWLVFGLAFGAAGLLVAHEAVGGRATVGDVVLALTMAGGVGGGVQSVAHSVNWLLENMKMGERLTWIEDAACEAAAAAAPRDPTPTPAALGDGIRLEGVTFRYPGTPTDGEAVLDGVDLLLPAGSTVAIVGDNGAGKTTLVKLLCRFYDPTGGRITVDGVDLRDLDVGEWRTRLSGCFQDFARLELLARQAVGVGDVGRVDDEPAVAAALDRAHATDVPGGLPSGLQTQLGRSFEGGVEPSTGQWQKLALGRAMMREQPLLLLLDEPTASLDPVTEAALFERYAGAAARTARRTGAITVLVSHRFSTVRMADLIVVLAGGRVAEIGTHEQLVAAAGAYAELYGLQARAYR